MAELMRALLLICYYQISPSLPERGDLVKKRWGLFSISCDCGDLVTKARANRHEGMKKWSKFRILKDLPVVSSLRKDADNKLDRAHRSWETHGYQLLRLIVNLDHTVKRSRSYLRFIFHHFQTLELEVDAFASETNTGFPKFVSKFPTPDSWGMDALQMDFGDPLGADVVFTRRLLGKWSGC